MPQHAADADEADNDDAMMMRMTTTMMMMAMPLMLDIPHRAEPAVQRPYGCIHHNIKLNAYQRITACWIRF